ncbi:hypothetical protein D910_10191 [Dendroctonus ponderosae]|uniref:Uncharacterized protein n=1 Tax=Dendroctonus ponderosae TaxID=77166 RepID=U4URW3_DENPD|nr:hypothetical protein D910_10191 [Dendroctonus ponderosae]
MAKAKFSAPGGKGLVLPSDVRWNSVADCLEAYATQWDILKICEDNSKDIDSAILKKVSNIGLKHGEQEYLSLLKPIAVALDILQKKNATISYAVEQWKLLQDKFEESQNLSLEKLQKFQHRYKQALTPYHFIVYMFSPEKQNYALTPEKKNLALETISELHVNLGLLPLVIKFNARCSPFK